VEVIDSDYASLFIRSTTY